MAAEVQVIQEEEAALRTVLPSTPPLLLPCGDLRDLLDDGALQLSCRGGPGDGQAGEGHVGVQQVLGGRGEGSCYSGRDSL